MHKIIALAAFVATQSLYALLSKPLVQRMMGQAGASGGPRSLARRFTETRTRPMTGFWPGTWRCLQRAGSRPPSPAWMHC